MTITSLMKQTVAVGLLFLSGCDAARSMRDDFGRLTSSQAAAQKPSPKSTTASPARSRSAPAAATPMTPYDMPPAPTAAASEAPPVRTASAGGTQIALAGKSEREVRAMLGTPTSEEDRPPGKRWRYRDGQCTLDVQLYPDVQTK